MLDRRGKTKPSTTHRRGGAAAWCTRWPSNQVEQRNAVVSSSLHPLRLEPSKSCPRTNQFQTSGLPVNNSPVLAAVENCKFQRTGGDAFLCLRRPHQEARQSRVRQRGVVFDLPHLGSCRQHLVEMAAPSCWIFALAVAANPRPIRG